MTRPGRGWGNTPGELTMRNRREGWGERESWQRRWPQFAEVANIRHPSRAKSIRGGENNHVSFMFWETKYPNMLRYWIISDFNLRLGISAQHWAPLYHFLLLGRKQKPTNATSFPNPILFLQRLERLEGSDVLRNIYCNCCIAPYLSYWETQTKLRNSSADDFKQGLFGWDSSERHETTSQNQDSSLAWWEWLHLINSAHIPHSHRQDTGQHRAPPRLQRGAQAHGEQQDSTAGHPPRLGTEPHAEASGAPALLCCSSWLKQTAS